MDTLNTHPFYSPQTHKHPTINSQSNIKFFISIPPDISKGYGCIRRYLSRPSTLPFISQYLGEGLSLSPAMSKAHRAQDQSDAALDILIPA